MLYESKKLCLNIIRTSENLQKQLEKVFVLSKFYIENLQGTLGKLKSDSTTSIKSPTSGHCIDLLTNDWTQPGQFSKQCPQH